MNEIPIANLFVVLQLFPNVDIFFLMSKCSQINAVFNKKSVVGEKKIIVL